MVSLLSLPIELLRLIPVHLHNSNDHKSLRETCWALRDIIVPDLFKKLSISFLQDPSLTQSQLGALADVEGISNAAAAQYTQTLSISLCPPGFKRRLQTDPETAVYLGKAHERDATTAAIMQSLEPAISALKMLRRVEIYINYDGLEEIPQCMLSAISGALEQLPLLCDHELAYCNTIRPTILLSPLSLARLKRLSVSSNNDRSTTQEHEPIDVRGEQYPGWVHLFEHAVSGAISHSHSLEELELDTSEMSIERDASVSGFFSGITGPVLKIHTLTIRTWWIDLAAVTLLIPHTRHLKRLNICGQEYIHGDNSGLDALFQALGASGVALHSLDISAMSKAIPEFLCSFSGLQRLVIRPNITLSRKQPEGWAQGGAERFQLADLSPAIIAQSATLNYLNLGTRLASFWAYNSDVSKAIRACKELTTLVVTSTGGSTVTNLLLQDAVSLPRLKTLIIVTCLMGISWTNDQKAYDRLPLKIHRRIVRFKVPETSALKEVSTGTIWFSRRGAALMPRHCGFRGYSYREFVYGMKAGDLSDSESEKDEEGTWWSHIRRRRRS